MGDWNFILAQIPRLKWIFKVFGINCTNSFSDKSVRQNVENYFSPWVFNWYWYKLLQLMSLFSFFFVPLIQQQIIPFKRFCHRQLKHMYFSSEKKYFFSSKNMWAKLSLDTHSQSIISYHIIMTYMFGSVSCANRKWYEFNVMGNKIIHEQRTPGKKTNHANRIRCVALDIEWYWCRAIQFSYL